MDGSEVGVVLVELHGDGGVFGEPGKCEEGAAEVGADGEVVAGGVGGGFGVLGMVADEGLEEVGFLSGGGVAAGGGVEGFGVELDDEVGGDGDVVAFGGVVGVSAEVEAGVVDLGAEEVEVLFFADFELDAVVFVGALGDEAGVGGEDDGAGAAGGAVAVGEPGVGSEVGVVLVGDDPFAVGGFGVEVHLVFFDGFGGAVEVEEWVDVAHVEAGDGAAAGFD